MRDVLEPARTRLDRGEPFALAVLVDAYASAPREVGTAMLVDAAGQVSGNVSAGCVDGAVYELCLQALSSGESTRSRYGISDERAFAAALTCGGVIDVLVVPVLPGSRAADALRAVIDAVERREAVARRRWRTSAAPRRPLLPSPFGTRMFRVTPSRRAGRSRCSRCPSRTRRGSSWSVRWSSPSPWRGSVRHPDSR